MSTDQIDKEMASAPLTLLCAFFSVCFPAFYWANSLRELQQRAYARRGLEFFEGPRLAFNSVKSKKFIVLNAVIYSYFLNLPATLKQVFLLIASETSAPC